MALLLLFAMILSTRQAQCTGYSQRALNSKQSDMSSPKPRSKGSRISSGLVVWENDKRMEQITELLDILKQTPQMAIWGLTVWCLYILAKLASVVYALKAVLQLFINKWHDIKVKGVDLQISQLKLNKREYDVALQEREARFNKKYSSVIELSRKFENNSVSSVEMTELTNLLDEVRSSAYIHPGDIRKAIKKLKA